MHLSKVKITRLDRFFKWNLLNQGIMNKIFKFFIKIKRYLSYWFGHLTLRNRTIWLKNYIYVTLREIKHIWKIIYLYFLFLFFTRHINLIHVLNLNPCYSKVSSVNPWCQHKVFTVDGSTDYTCDYRCWLSLWKGSVYHLCKFFLAKKDNAWLIWT